MPENVVSGEILTRASKRVGLIATVPRSGTWYNSLFFNFYDQLLQGKTEVTVTSVGAPLSLAGVDLGVSNLLVCHTICPGFERYCGEYRVAWDKLNFHVDGYNWAESLIDERIHLLDPELNGDVRIVYYYRNPLDQAVSAFMHAQKHTDPRQRSYTDSSGNRHFIKDVREYLFRASLESYIKQFLTFKVMRPIYPQNILGVKYENLVRNPEYTFASVLKYFGHDVDDPSHQAKIIQAIKLSSKDTLKRIEKSIGHSIAHDQTDPNESHVRDGAIGKWKQHLNENDIQLVQEWLARFGLSLEEFDIE